jgi:tetratricopeptide (TPR) repeat protein/tRNA A-37 threonylcarbamoyl transferase component Bud32
MNADGLSDFTGSAFRESQRCECGSAATITMGLCVRCLLRCGLRTEEAGEESFDETLAAIEICDSDWQLGNYQILEEIGRGGMGVIYRARQRHSRRIVALKRVLSYHSDSHETLTRFRREAEAAASLDHPNILPIYEVAVSEDGLPFFSMKFAPGGSLLHARTMYRDRPRATVQLIAKVARAIEHAHSAGILHRDLKPGNILLDARGEPLVSDFGLAKWIDATSDLTRTMMVFGTPGYIAPEQVDSPTKLLTPAVDVYSLGAILFELLSGRPPFVAEHAIAVIHEATERPAPKLRSIAPTLSRDLETICARCLERDPLARYQSAGTLADDLERWLEGRAITARPISAPARLWRWSNRNRRLAGSLGICILLLLAVSGRQYQAHRLAKALQDAAAARHSIAVIPFLDLNGIRPDAAIGTQLAGLFQRQLSKFGPSRVTVFEQALKHWTGAGLEDEVREALHDANSRFVLSGTRRRVAGKLRISLHLISENGTDSLGNWIREIQSGRSNELGQVTEELAPTFYKLLDSTGDAAAAPADPVLASERARKFFVAGRDLIARRTTPELDRAIACLENAVREEPRSISARSYLSMAYMGRDLLSTKPELAARAIASARQAVRLAPENATAHRALCPVIGTYGRYREALEEGLQSIELGDRSERAFGQVAYTWRMLGRPDLGVLWYEKARLSQHQPADYDALLGDCCADLTADTEAQREYESAASFHPDQPEGWMGLCRLKLLAGETQQARQIYRAELPHYLDFAVARQLAAMVEFFSRDFVAAESFYLDLAAADRLGGGRGQFYGAIDYCSALGRLKLERGEKNTGRSLIEESIAAAKLQLASAPDDCTMLYRLAAAESTAGQSAAALKHLRAAIAAGWVDYRSAQLDPRFDPVSGLPEFKNILTELAAHVAQLGRRALAGCITVNAN